MDLDLFVYLFRTVTTALSIAIMCLTSRKTFVTLE